VENSNRFSQASPSAPSRQPFGSSLRRANVYLPFKEKLRPEDPKLAEYLSTVNLRSASDGKWKYELKALPGNFSGLHLICLMYVAFKSIAPEMDIGFDLATEYAAAKALRGQEDEH